MSKPNLKIVEQAPATEEVLAAAIAGLAEAEQTAARFRAIIAEEGRALWHERNPGQKLFGHLRIETIKGMLER